MKKVFSFFLLIILSSFFSCNQINKKSYSINDYENASKHLSKNLNKYLLNTINSQKWDKEDFLFYKVKKESKIESFKIDLKSYKKISLNKQEYFNNFEPKTNRDEFLSPNGNLFIAKQLSENLNKLNLFKN